MRGLFVFLFLGACQASQGTSDSSAPPASAWVAPPPEAGSLTDERLATLDRWNDAMRVHDLAKLTSLYDERVLFYGLPMPRVAALTRLDHLFRSVADYGQTVAHAVVASPEGSDTVRISFTKNATAHGKSTSYAAYLVLRLVGSTYRIVEESDVTTDATMTKLSETRYPDACRRAIGAAFDELWASRVGTSGVQIDDWFECPHATGHQCAARDWRVPPEQRFDQRMLSLDVDLVTGALVEQGGWASDADAGLTMAPEVHAKILDACRGAKVYGHGK